MKWIIVLIVLLVFFIIKRMTVGWMSPARICSLVWTVQIVGYVLLTTNITYDAGIFYLILCSFVFALGELASTRYMITFRGRMNYAGYDIRDIAWVFLLIFILLGILKNILTISRYGFNISNFTNISSFLDMNTSMAYQRYFGDNSTSLIESILSTFIYLAALYSGYLFNSADTLKKKIICFLAFIPPIITVLSQNTKLVPLDSVFLFVVGYCISYLCTNDKTFKLRPKIIFIISLVFAGLFALFFISMCAKIGSFDERTIGIVRNKIGVYAFGSIEAFSAWFGAYRIPGNITFGISTFLAPFDLLHIVERSQGVYEAIPGISSNIFTGYRALIQDFSSIGALIVVFISGAISGILYRKVKRGASSFLCRTLYGCYLFTCLHYWLGSPWVYTSLWLTFILFGLVITFSNKKKYIKRKDYLL